MEQLGRDSKINPDIQKERDTRTFSYEELADLLAGGAEERCHRNKIKAAVKAEKGFSGPDLSFLSREQRHEEEMRKSALMVKKKIELSDLIRHRDDYIYFKGLVNKDRPNVFFDMHEFMFIQTLQRMATDEQKAKWLLPAKNYQIIGTYAQTEMGHGTFLRGLETTANYDPETEEFVVHSPTTSSIKWWPGALGKTCTHAIVMAQLYIRDICYGLHAFVVQLRSLEDHTSLPGITLGDIGPKFGFNESDNGFLKFDHVRIPRGNMLMKYAQVLRDGTYQKSPRKELAYGTMTFARSSIVANAALSLSRACTIAIRYSAVRRQSEMRPGEPEPQILDYVTQQHKLFPLLATSYAFFFAKKRMTELFRTISEDVKKGDYREMKELHAVSSGLKAFTTSVVARGIEVCRMSCGGHGYSLASGFSDIYTNFVVYYTAEGEYTVLMLQTARFLIKCIREGGALGPSVAYLKKAQPKIENRVNFNDLENLCSLYEQRARGLVKFVAGKVDDEIKSGEDLVGALNKVAVHSVRAANAHCHYYVIRTFVDEIRQLKLSPSLKPVLIDLARIYALDGISKNSGEFIEEGLLTPGDVKSCYDMVVGLLTKIRPNAVSLVDVFEYTDDYLISVLGRYDGNVYENLLKWAMKSDLNKTDVIPAYHKHIQPLIKRHQAKL